MTSQQAKEVFNQAIANTIERKSRLIAELLTALRSADLWIETICERTDIDPEQTVITVSAVSPEGKRELANRSLAAAVKDIRAAIAQATAER